MLYPGLQKSIDRREKVLASVRNRDKVPSVDGQNCLQPLSAFNKINIPLHLIYFCSTETRDTTASAGILFTVLSYQLLQQWWRAGWIGGRHGPPPLAGLIPPPWQSSSCPFLYQVSCQGLGRHLSISPGVNKSDTPTVLCLVTILSLTKQVSSCSMAMFMPSP